MVITKKLPLVGFLAMMMAACGGNPGVHAANKPDPANQALAERARAVLIRAVTEEKMFVQVHAADALVDVGESEAVRKIYEPKRPVTLTSAAPVGELRALVGSARTAKERADYIAQVEQIFLKATGLTQIQAIETISKLGHPIKGEVLEAARKLANTADDSVKPFVLWALHIAGDKNAMARTVALMDSKDEVARSRAVYVVGWEGTKDPAVLAKLAKGADSVSPGDKASANFVGAAFKLKADPSRMAAWQARLEDTLANGPGGGRYSAAQMLRYRYTPADLPKLAPNLDHPDADARIGAAWAILYVLKHSHQAK